MPVVNLPNEVKKDLMI